MVSKKIQPRRGTRLSNDSSKPSQPTAASPMTNKKREPTYEVEKILDKKLINKKAHYKVKWVGYSLKDSTWEPMANLNCPELVKAFEKQMANSRGNITKKPKPSPKKQQASKEDEDSLSTVAGSDDSLCSSVSRSRPIGNTGSGSGSLHGSNSQDIQLDGSPTIGVGSSAMRSGSGSTRPSTSGEAEDEGVAIMELTWMDKGKKKRMELKGRRIKIEVLQR